MSLSTKNMSLSTRNALMIAQTQTTSNTSSQTTSKDTSAHEQSRYSLQEVTRETIEKASLLKLFKTKHELVMLLGRLWEQYGSIHVGLAKLSNMLVERIDKHLQKRQMVTLSQWLVDAGLVTRWRDNKHYGKYHYKLTAIGMAYFHIHMHRIQKSAPVISEKCTSLTKNIYEEKEIKIPEPPVHNFTEPTPKTVDIDSVKQTIILTILLASPKTRKQTVVKWVNMFGAKAVEDIFNRCKLYSPDNLGRYMSVIFRDTPPARIDKERVIKFEPVVKITEQESLVGAEHFKSMRALAGLRAGVY